MHTGTCSRKNISPASNFAVHNARGVKVSKQVIHEVVVLLVLLGHSMVTRYKGSKNILHEPLQTLLLTRTVLLQQLPITARPEVTYKEK